MDYKFRGTNVLKIIGWVMAGLVIAAGTAFLFGFVVMLLWNWLMPEIFGLTEISYLQAWGLVLLAHILFKSGGHSQSGRFGRRGHGFGHRHGRGRKHGEQGEDWKREFFSKMHEHDIHVQKEEKEPE
jgi:uncharacterized membrane protein YgcG